MHRTLFVAVLLVGSASANEEVMISIKDHRFDPAEISVPAGQKVTLRIANEDATPEEFESDDLDVEKVIAGQQSVTVEVGPLDPGRYEFYGEYHEGSAKGAIVVK